MFIIYHILSKNVCCTYIHFKILSVKLPPITHTHTETYTHFLPTQTHTDHHGIENVSCSLQSQITLTIHDIDNILQQIFCQTWPPFWRREREEKQCEKKNASSQVQVKYKSIPCQYFYSYDVKIVQKEQEIIHPKILTKLTFAAD